MNRRGRPHWPWAALLALLAAACASPPPGPGTPAPAAARPGPAVEGEHGVLFRCEDGTVFTARFLPGEVVISGLPGGAQRLLRDAGGTTPAQVFYAGTTLRAEFGHGTEGQEAVLRHLPPAERVQRCRRD